MSAPNKLKDTFFFVAFVVAVIAVFLAFTIFTFPILGWRAIAISLIVPVMGFFAWLDGKRLLLGAGVLLVAGILVIPVSTALTIVFLTGGLFVMLQSRANTYSVVKGPKGANARFATWLVISLSVVLFPVLGVVSIALLVAGLVVVALLHNRLWKAEDRSMGSEAGVSSRCRQCNADIPVGQTNCSSCAADLPAENGGPEGIDLDNMADESRDTEASSRS